MDNNKQGNQQGMDTITNKETMTNRVINKEWNNNKQGNQQTG